MHMFVCVCNLDSTSDYKCLMNEYILKYKVQPQPNLNTTLPGGSEENHKKSQSAQPVLGNCNAKHTTRQLCIQKADY